MKWGVFELNNGEIHVAPVNVITHDVMNGHDLNMNCFCKPKIIYEDKRVVINHYENHN